MCAWPVVSNKSSLTDDDRRKVALSLAHRYFSIHGWKQKNRSRISERISERGALIYIRINNIFTWDFADMEVQIQYQVDFGYATMKDGFGNNSTSSVTIYFTL
jgi:hypothetical protein